MQSKFSYIILFFAAMFFSSCELFDNETAYFNVEGEGYVYYEDTRLPTDSVRVKVTCGFKSQDWATKQPIDRYYFTDINGFYRVRFLKKVDGENTVYTRISASDLNNEYNVSSVVVLNQNILSGQTKTISIDTVWINK